MLNAKKPSAGLRFTLNVGNLPPETFTVVGFTLSEQFSLPFVLNLEAVSTHSSVAFGTVLDSTATLTIRQDTEVLRTVNGIVSEMEQGDAGLHQTRYRITIHPALWRAGLVRHSRIFQQQSVQEILETLLKKHLISDYAFALRYPRAVREFCVQYQESDADFINRLAAEEGMFYFFEHQHGKHTLVFADDCAALNAGPTLPYRPEKPIRSDEWGVTTFRRRESLRPSDVLLKDYTFKKPRWPAESREYARDTEHQSGRYLHYDYPGRYKGTGPTGEHFARWRIQALRNSAHQGEGATNCPALQPGIRFTLEDHPLETHNTRWQITHSTYIGRQPQALETEAGEEGTTLMGQFAFIPQDQTWRPLSLPKPRIDGAQIAIVTGPDTEEIFCDEYGRVRVRFLWDLSDKTDDSSSCWVRVSHPWAGQGWGMSAIPRIGHEVIVEFLNGDPDQPVIIGRTYHVSNLPPGNLPGTKTQMTLRSQTHKGDGFNELRFEDERDREEIYIHAQQDMNTDVLRDQTTTINRDMQLTVDNNRTSVIKVDDDESVGGYQTLSVTKDQSITIEGQHSTVVKKSRFLEVTDNDSLKVGKHISIHSDSGQILIGNAGGRIVIDPIGNIRIEGVSITLAEHSAGGMPPSPLFTYSARYTLFNEHTGTPLINAPYTIKGANGQVVSGKTDAQGRTLMVRTEKEDNLQLDIPETQKPVKTRYYQASNNAQVERVMEFKESHHE
ncbi:type VI secretion system tip protein VgrG [Pectobacterium parmentieri]|uniref:type VI secretion system Vgr family protein n=1 Tax=Pectobacterium parmentieri TaxID=1905730 RepID=UPI000EAFAB80|nr:type VI secretion system tip protein TssI/VgrG [Pectobacterium parmentieri]AYH02689.1 type VI secretion system tip protein VgrG [Pectobacterium parmentieri]AYH28949.1 type VI secretion system tip protein VgrG [Pectobacterium parmentieri]AYH33367.1 type VI secretion system tip protein VgrG [Pectobacterium parmentieri]MBI0472705.1 type VI secretion system tip protein VgrG [Pectobacterium parmentieri]MBI0495348.1 type VI secretion system tip protein VgrG [Pectobacterium parmentieri]